MALVAITPEYEVNYDYGIMRITRVSDGCFLVFEWPRLILDFQGHLKRYAKEYVIDIYIETALSKGWKWERRC